MSMPSSCQIHPTSLLNSFQSSCSRFHSVRLPIFRYASSIPYKKHKFYLTHYSLNSVSDPDKYPPRKSSFSSQNKKESPSLAPETPLSTGGGISISTWIHTWNSTHYPKLPKRPQALLDYRNDGGDVSGEEDYGDDNDELVTSSSSNSSTMARIVEKLKKFGYVDNVSETKERLPLPERGSVEDIFYVEDGMLPNSRGGFDSPFSGIGGDGDVRFPWEKPVAQNEEEEKNRNSVRRKSKTSVAELTIPETELRRLRHLSLRTKPRTKIGGSGVTQAVVDAIHEKWKVSEVVRIKCEGPPALNMRRMHEILERKTGGVVIWRSGTSLSLYRGVSYELPSMKQSNKQIKNTSSNSHTINSDTIRKDTMEHHSRGDIQLAEESLVAFGNEVKENPVLEVSYENEIDKLLDSLGPRYTDWPGGDPLPIDADLLPGVVPGYQPPFRILPYGVRSNLGLNEMTALRRLARVLPPHFAVGRSRQHQGLAMAMVKLWEKSSIAKVALKRGVQLTTSERMSEDIKNLTGGKVLSRNKDFIVFYRGKDFLSPEVTDALVERERLVNALQDDEEQARLRAGSFVIPTVERTEESGSTGTLGETLEADARWGKKLDGGAKIKVMRAAEVARHANLVRKLELKLTKAERKLMKAERALAKVEVFLKPVDRPVDPESISDEERFMFRKVGLKMKAFLLLGRRGVFDGTVENMHLHWKYRELVKILVKAPNFNQVKKIALSLEAESGGVLVSVDKVSKGFAIIVYRGRDYHRPSYLRPKNLLTKRKALARSIELQRHEALDNHISTLSKRVELLRSELNQMENVKDQGDEELYAKLDSSYSSDEEEDIEDESEEAYLETYDSENENDGDNRGGDIDESVFNFPYDDDHQQEAWDTV